MIENLGKQFTDPSIRFRYVPGHKTHHQFAAYAKVPTDIGNGVMFPMTRSIGELAWNKKTGVAKIAVHPDFQRQGIGTELWRQATAYSERFGHVSPNATASTTRTDSGDAFLKSVDLNAGERKYKADDDFGDFFEKKEV